jgi:hypothetical protein
MFNLNHTTMKSQKIQNPMGGAIQRVKNQILNGQEEGFKTFMKWVCDGCLTDNQYKILVDANEQYFSNKK